MSPKEPVQDLFDGLVYVSNDKHCTSSCSNMRTCVTCADGLKSNNISFMSANCMGTFAGLMTRPCHGLVDSGAQDGVIGLWHFHRWLLCLWTMHRLQPLYHPMPTGEAGGKGPGPASAEQFQASRRLPLSDLSQNGRRREGS